MDIHFSRHARRRLALYDISESKVIEILSNKTFSEGKNEYIEFVDSMKYPIKIIIYIEGERGTVITVYPLRKGLNS